MTERTKGKRPNYKKLDGGVFLEITTEVRPRRIEYQSKRISQKKQTVPQGVPPGVPQVAPRVPNNKDEDVTHLVDRLHTMSLSADEHSDGELKDIATGGDEDDNGFSSDNDRDNTNKTIIHKPCLLYTSPSPRDYAASRMPSSA